MAVLPIRKYGDPILRQKATQISEIDDNIRSLISDMFNTMREAGGVGLAAPQVGRSLSLIVVDLSPLETPAEPLVLINPRVIQEEGEWCREEGCLSLPGINEEIARAEFVVVEGLDEIGNHRHIKGEGMLARILLHEVDHLNGVLIIDRLSPIRRNLLRTKLRKLAKGENH